MTSRFFFYLLIACVVPTSWCTAQVTADYWKAATPDTTRLHYLAEQSSVSLTSQYQAGSFRRPFDPARSTYGRLSTYGLRKLSGWTFDGGFRYSYTNEADVWRTGVADPYRNNFYIWTDTARGDWTRHELQGHWRVATPESEGRLFGIRMEYTAGQGARDTRPKPLYRLNRVSLDPFVEFDAGKLRVHLTASYRYRREEDEMGGAYTSGNVLLYRLRGFGTFDKTSFISGVRFYRSHSGMAKSLVSYSFDGRQLFLEAMVATVGERVVEGIAEPVDAGRYRETSAGARLSIFPGDKNKPTIGVSWFRINGNGIDPMFNAVNAGLVRTQTVVSVTQPFGRVLRYSSLSLSHTTDHAFDEITITNWNIRRVSVDWSADVVIRRWTLQPAFGYGHTYKDDVEMRKPTEVSSVVVNPYLLYLSASTFQARLLTKLDVPVSSSNILSIGLVGSILTTSNGDQVRFSIAPQLTLSL